MLTAPHLLKGASLHLLLLILANSIPNRRVPRPQTAMSAKKEIVLVSGLTGFIASDVALTFLRTTAYTVRGTVRSQSKGQEWIALHPEYKERVEPLLTKPSRASPILYTPLVLYRTSGQAQRIQSRACCGRLSKAP